MGGGGGVYLNLHKLLQVLHHSSNGKQSTMHVWLHMFALQVYNLIPCCVTMTVIALDHIAQWVGGGGGYCGLGISLYTL